MQSYLYSTSHCGNKTVVRSSYLHNMISYSGKMTSWISLQCPTTSLYWNSPLIPLVIFHTDFVNDICVIMIVFWNTLMCIPDRCMIHVRLTNSRALIQYKDAILTAEEIPLWTEARLTFKICFPILLTLNVRGPIYLGFTSSISLLLMPWLLASPWHQQPWYWLCIIGRFMSYLRNDFNYLRRINVEKLHKM